MRGQKPVSEGYPSVLETIGDHVRKRRLELGLTRREAADLIGVHFTTIMEWELGGRTPASRFLEGMVGFLGYLPTDLAELLHV